MHLIYRWAVYPLPLNRHYRPELKIPIHHTLKIDATHWHPLILNNTAPSLLINVPTIALPILLAVKCAAVSDEWSMVGSQRAGMYPCTIFRTVAMLSIDPFFSNEKPNLCLRPLMDRISPSRQPLMLYC